VRWLVSNSSYAKKNRNGPPSANQVASKDEPRCGHAVCTLRVHPPTSPCPALSAHAEPKPQGHCRKWHHEAESLMTLIGAMGPKGLNMAETTWNCGKLYVGFVYVCCMWDIIIARARKRDKSHQTLLSKHDTWTSQLRTSEQLTGGCFTFANWLVTRCLHDWQTICVPQSQSKTQPCTDPFRISTASDNSLYDVNLPQVLQAVVHSLDVLSDRVWPQSQTQRPLNMS